MAETKNKTKATAKPKAKTTAAKPKTVAKPKAKPAAKIEEKIEVKPVVKAEVKTKAKAEIKVKTNQIKIQLIRSLIGSSQAQRKVAKALGLTKTNQIVEQAETPIIMGMVRKITHLVKVVK